MSVHLARPLVAVVLGSVALAGCGKSDAPTASAGSGASSTMDGANAAVDPGKPAAANDLIGTWFRNDDAAARADDVIGVEFTKDNKLTLVGRPAGRQSGGEMTLDATRLDGGRVRLAAPGMAGVTQTVQCNLSGDTVTITSESPNADFEGGTFTRLPAGKTIVARYQEHVKERLAEARALGEKLNAFLAQPDLAIVPADAGGAGSLRVALKLTNNNGTFVGTGLMTVGNATVERQVQLAASPNSQPPVVECTLGPVVGPAGAKPMAQESFQFAASAKGDTIELRDKQAHLLKPDADASKGLADAYAAAVRKQRDMLDAFHAKLGALVLCEGDARPNQPTPRVALLRVPDKDQYLMAEYRGSDATLLPTGFTSPYAVMLQDDQPFLVSSQTRQMLTLAGEGDARTIEGQFAGGPARMRIARTITLDEMKARQAAIKTFADGLKATPLALCGQFYESYTYEMGAVRPIRLTLSSTDGKTLAGTFRSDVIDADLPIVGEVTPTLLGLTIRYAPAKLTQNVIGRFDEDQQTLASVELVDGKVASVTGRAERGDGANRVELAPPSHERVAKLRSQFDDAVARGGTFKWARTGNTGGSTEAMTLTLKPGDDSGKLTGTAGFRKNAAAPITGTIAEDRGQLVIDLTLAETPPKTIAAGTMRLWVLPYGDTFYLSGHRDWKGEKSQFACYGPTAQ